jgi:hypothetical protein
MKKSISWIIAVLITLSVGIFQFMMNMTHPLVVQVNTGKERIECELKRSYSGISDCPIVLPIRDLKVSGYILYKIYPSENPVSKINFNREGDKLIARLPVQKPSGKLEYSVFLEREGTPVKVNEGKPVVISFLGRVPLYILVLHSLIIFLAVLYSTHTGILAGLGDKTYRWTTFLTLTILLGVVFLLQPLMHYHSLNRWWTCFPNSLELGDNKFLLALLIWLFTAYVTLKKAGPLRKARPVITVFASIISLLLFSVPHGFPRAEYEPVTIESFFDNLVPFMKLF